VVRNMRLAVIITPDEEGGYVVECPALPGCVSQGETIDEALTNIREAAELCLEVMVEQGDDLPDGLPQGVLPLLAVVEVRTPVPQPA